LEVECDLCFSFKNIVTKVHTTVKKHSRKLEVIGKGVRIRNCLEKEFFSAEDKYHIAHIVITLT
jgi:hypothetical protein